jgi:effector-binding domain-containing protein
MEIKEAPAMQVLAATRRLSIPQVRVEAAVLTAQVAAEAEARGLVTDGPWTFIAQNLPRDGRTPFDIRFCLPVAGAATAAGSFELLVLEPIMVASAIYHGPLRSLFTTGYAPLVAEIEVSRHAFSGESREIYHQWGREGSGYQKIEIQFGLSR